MSRSPYGERGLKYRRDIPVQRGCESLSLRRAWIEITSRPLPPPTRSSLSLRRAWIEIARANASDGPSRSLSLRRAWIEITIRPFVIGWPCRSPYGERGLKFGAPAEPERDDASLSLRRAWIEMDSRPRLRCLPRRSPYGERGLKYQGVRRHDLGPRRSPYGERGLKSYRYSYR